jgi:hypothetical protein
MNHITVNGTKRVIQVGRQIRIIKPTARASIKTIGVQGRPGRDGLGTAFEYIQNPASSEWIINHNLGYKPNHGVIDTGGNVIQCAAQHFSVNQLRLYFSPPVAGVARLI